MRRHSGNAATGSWRFARIVAVSAPTALALRAADEAGITVVAIARGDGFEIFTHPERVVLEAAQGTGNVALGA
jgi:FdhD protein